MEGNGTPFRHRFRTDGDRLNCIPHRILPDSCSDNFGHANKMALNKEECLRMIGKRLKCLHVNGNNGRLDDHILPFSGNIAALSGILRSLTGKTLVVGPHDNQNCVPKRAIYWAGDGSGNRKRI